MKNGELIMRINFLSDIKKRQIENGEKLFKGGALLIVSRNLRAMYKEYSENYLKDLEELRGRYYENKESEVMIPADEESGIGEHMAKKSVEVLKPDCKEEDFQREWNELLDMEVTVPLSYLTYADLSGLEKYEDAEMIDFMVK